jgi:hypothetical protein
MGHDPNKQETWFYKYRKKNHKFYPTIFKLLIFVKKNVGKKCRKKICKKKLHMCVTKFIYACIQGRMKLGRQEVTWEGHNLHPLVDIGLTDLPKPGWAIAHSAHPFHTPLHYCVK